MPYRGLMLDEDGSNNFLLGLRASSFEQTGLRDGETHDFVVDGSVDRPCESERRCLANCSSSMEMRSLFTNARMEESMCMNEGERQSKISQLFNPQ
ncbi:uncharacterized protein LOC109504479 isoform X2 [Harpegnathos saltator]|uniref:uncharacterized protein LOC109504479 isoform X2 n=1 Tax=Harpegnathos saltator TaxID=610380 RepID=UPI00094899D1|nr:uncharacterized protein LOC109504479 isoform X2 [Harpegnathos saltator]